MEIENKFDLSLYGVPEGIRRTLEFLPQKIKAVVQEIRLRAGLPLTLTIKGKTYFVRRDGSISEFITGDMVITSQKELQSSFLLLCKNSVYAHAAELRNGYITMPSGNRAGVCGRFDEKGYLSDVTSINIRIARQIKGAADALLKAYDGSMLIAGPPASGKTTILRDLIRALSSGEGGKYYRVAAIDSRGELSGGTEEDMKNNLGSTTDVILIENKALGTEIALRTLSPQIIAFDEIGTAAELRGISDCFNAGVDIITTAHINRCEDLFHRSVTRDLLNMGIIRCVAVLSGDISAPIRILKEEEILRLADF